MKLSDAPDAAVQFFAVKQSGKIVGVSALVLGDGLAGVYCVATLKEHRRQGIGAVLAARPLLAAGEVGYEKAVLQASADGYNVYKRLGFVDSGEVQLYMKLPAGTSMDH